MYKYRNTTWKCLHTIKIPLCLNFDILQKFLFKIGITKSPKSAQYKRCILSSQKTASKGRDPAKFVKPYYYVVMLEFMLHHLQNRA